MLYLDASALVKRYVAEPGSDLVRDAMLGSHGAWVTCRIGLVETFRAVGFVGGRAAAERVREEWPSIGVVEVTPALAAEAAELSLSQELRTLDALHLAAATRLPAADLTVATWDRRLHAAALRHNLQTLPATLD
ncbi:MAG TPA: type II toxin-antitoxin system VapC family toxin [Conexibacter sp.]|jgi:predicted nucleic acid-binding protein